MKKITLLLILTLNCSVFSQEATIKIPKQTQKSFIKLDYLSVKMPENETNMGLSGIHYNLNINNWGYAGLGFYGSIKGIRGGFFTLGANAGIKKNLNSKLYIDTGIYIGAGGGASAPDGGGAVFLPHLNFGYQFSKFSIDAGYSYINFFDKGNIVNHQINASVQIPLSYDYASFSAAEKEFAITKDSQTSGWNQKTKKISASFHLNNLNLQKDTKNNSGELITDKTINLAGFEINSYFNDKTFAFLKLDGAYHGVKAGYMDIILGMGYQLSFNKNRTNILAKFGIGAGGGGGVETNGGLLVYPDISIEQKITKNIYIFINKGYLLSPNTAFVASTFGGGLKYYLNHSGTYTKEKTFFSSAKFKGYEITIGQELYLDAVRDDKTPSNMQQLLVQFNFYLNKNIYATGQTSFANFGNAGAYAEGIVGLGYNTSPLLNDKLKFFAQVLAGAAGGGGISTNQGLIFKPSIGATYLLNDKLGIRISGGKVKTKGDGLNSTFANIGLTYRFSSLNAYN